MRILKALLSLTALIILVVAVPLILLAIGVWRIDWANLLTRPDDGSVLLSLITAIAWCAWLVFVTSVVAEVVAIVRDSPLAIRLPGFSWLARLLIGSLLAVTVAAQPVGVVPQAISAPQIPDRTADSPSTHNVSYVVVAGDDLWSLAERFYGSGIQWRKIYAANESVLGPRPTELVPGTRLVLPDLSDADVTKTTRSSSSKPKQPKTVDRPAPKREPQSEANHTTEAKPSPSATPSHPTGPVAGTEESQRKAPNVSKTSVPKSTPQANKQKRSTDRRESKKSAPESASSHMVYVVKRGDSLWRIAMTQLGDPYRWPEILSLNRSMIADPDEIDIGWRLRLPTDSASAGGVRKPSTPASQPNLKPGNADQAPSPQSGSDTSAEQRSHVAPPGVDSPRDGGPIRQASYDRNSPANGSQVSPDKSESVGVRELLGPINTMAAASVVGAISSSHIRRAMLRPIGTRTPSLSAAQSHLEAALRRLAVSSPPPSGLRIPLGDTDEAEFVWIDLSEYPSLAISSTDSKDSVAMVTSILFCVCGDVAIDCHLVDPPIEVAEALEHWPDPVSIETMREARQSWAELAVERGKPTSDELKIRPSIYLCYPTGSPIPEPVAGQAWVSIQDESHGDSSAQVIVANERSARLKPQGVAFRPSLVDHLSRHAIRAMLAAAETDAYETAPWWSEQAPDNVLVLPNANVSITQLRPPPALPEETAQPKLHLLGAIHLTGARGEAPSRARMQCLEYLAWILEHPGESAIALSNALFVADSTRRSNVSRLRSWLGVDDSGAGYLPNAYSQRLRLSSEVDSDWQELQQLIAGGVNRCQMKTLVAALQLVRGAPLADAAPGQWAWAEHLRTEMAETIRDIGYQLAELALERGDTELAAWAANRALIAAPSDEALLRQKLRAAQLAGDSDSVTRLAKQLTDHARQLGVDLDTETVVVIQQAVEGRLRQRAIPSRIP